MTRGCISSKGKTDLLFISWSQNCSRSDSIAERLGGKSFMIYSPVWGSRYSTVVFKYLSQTIKTLKILFRYRPRTVLVMTPPVIACVPVWLYAKLTGAQYGIDAHSGAFLDRRWTSTLFVHQFFSYHSVVTMVTSPFLSEIVQRCRGNTIIVSDVPICFAEPRQIELKGMVNMTFISTFTRDEPLEAFLSAASQVPDVQFYVTGRLGDANSKTLKQAPENVTFTDFLNNSDYVGLLAASDAVICLTTEDHTMQRGAYEAVYLGKPVITSKFDILRMSFPKGTVHVENNSKDIAEGIREMRDNLDRYRREVEQLRSEKLERWRQVETELNGLFGRAHDEVYSEEHPGTAELVEVSAKLGSRKRNVSLD
jgi:glycosyltransferase involved in cell wall biosynthesis